MKKIAVVTDDGQTISMHFGRATHYAVFTVEDGAITGMELRDKMGHRQFADQPHDPADDHAHDDHDHHHEHEHGHGHDHGRGHGFGQHAEHKHGMMIAAIEDCDAVIARGMGRGAYLAMQNANITPYVTTIKSAEEAVKAYIAGDLADHTEKLH